jgi:hypothetical protein
MDGPPPPPPPPPPQAAAAAGGGGGGGGAWKHRPTRRFKAGEQIFIRGGRHCYLRPACSAEQAKSRHKGKLSGPRIFCAKPAAGKPSAQETQFLWKAHPCTSPEGQKKGYVRFENGKHKHKYLCLTRKEHKSPKRRQGVHFGILGCKKNRGCGWKVKEAKVYNRRTKQLETRFVFVNRKHKRYMLRSRRRCKQAPPGPRRLFGAQNYIREARVDPLGAFIIEPAGGGGYDT